ncbi:hypothetical protein EAO69_14855 [Streptomyces sp. me109]|nr:hypothetical protein EAO69_14855 [Streptomyces sp. me109]
MHFVLDQFDTQRGQFVVLNELCTRAVRDEAMRGTLDAGDTAWKDYLLGILRAGQDGGHLRAGLDPDAAAILITGFLKSLLLHPGLTGLRPQCRRRAAPESRTRVLTVLGLSAPSTNRVGPLWS